MNITPIIIAIVIAAVQIFCNNGDKEHLKNDFPEINFDRYGPSNHFLVILIIVEVFYLVYSFFPHAVD